MGSMGDSAFDNDHALDWVDELKQSKKPLALIEKSLRALLRSSEDAYECDRAIAAAEVVAAFQGNASRALTEVLMDWLAESSEVLPDHYPGLALEACQRILVESELKVLNDNDASWRRSIGQIIARLEKPGKPRKPAKKKAPDSDSSSIPAAIKVIKAKGGYVLLENRVPHSAGTDSKADVEFFKNLGVLTTLKNLFIGETKSAIPKGAFEYLASLTKLNELSLQDARIEDDHLSVLRHFELLDDLNLQATNITDKGLKNLENCRKVTRLNLAETRAFDVGVSYLTGMTKLENLNLRNTQVTDKCLSVIAQLSKLESLILAGTNLSGSGLKALSGLRKLGRLDLSRTKLNDRALGAFANENVRFLDLGETLVSGKGLSAVSALLRLANLKLDRCPLTDAHLKHLSTAPLEELWLSGCPITDRGAEFLAACPKLKYLNLSGTAMTDDGVKVVCQSKSLRTLDLEGTKITNQGLGFLAEQLQIDRLILNKTQVTLAGLKSFVGNPKIAYLAVSPTSLPYDKVRAIFKKIRESQPKGKQVFDVP
jgi:hypothetical protein